MNNNREVRRQSEWCEKLILADETEHEQMFELIRRTEGESFAVEVKTLLERVTRKAESASFGYPISDARDRSGVCLGERYVLLRAIGKGSFGEAWLAKDLRLNGRKVCVKLASFSVHSERYRNVVHEMSLLSELHHPRIIAPTDFGELAGDGSYMVTPWINGDSLHTHLRVQTEVDVAESLRIVACLKDALSYLHGQNVLHLDLKPSNVMLWARGAAPAEPVLIDFGLARVTAGGVFESSGHPYQAPERLLGRASSASDVFSLAMIARDLISGGPAPKLPSAANPRVARLFVEAMTDDPGDRPSLADFWSRLVAEFSEFSRRHFETASHLPFSLVEGQSHMKNYTDNDSTHGSFGRSLDDMNAVRSRIADLLVDLAQYMKDADEQQADRSGGLSLNKQVSQLTKHSDQLRAGRYPIAVIGDMKRGKSTLINAILNEDILPTDVARCTAVLTKVIYGESKEVEVHFHSRTAKAPSRLSFEEFKKQYTLTPEMQEAFEERKESAFPDVEYALVRHPNPMFEKGVVIIDTPGLNDNAELDELSLEFARECSAILFVLTPSTLVTRTEKGYLANYLNDRETPIFFIVNKWDSIKSGLDDPDSEDELRRAESRVMAQIESSVMPYLDRYAKGDLQRRLFPISAKEAWRRLQRDPDANLDGTGFVEFSDSLAAFLREDRLRMEVSAARRVANRSAREAGEKITTQINLVATSHEELEKIIRDATPKLAEMRKIGREVSSEFDSGHHAVEEALKQSFDTHIDVWDRQIEGDLKELLPKVGFFQLMSKSGKEKFANETRDILERYSREVLKAWEPDAHRTIETTVSRFDSRIKGLANEYKNALDIVRDRIADSREYGLPSENDETWTTRAGLGFLALLTGDVFGAVMAGNRLFGWKDITFQIVGLIVANILAVIVFGGPLGILAGLVGGLVLAIFRVPMAQERIAGKIAEELRKGFPDMKRKAGDQIALLTREFFSKGRDEVLSEINDQIDSLEFQLNDALKQKGQRDINSQEEADRLSCLQVGINERAERVEKEEEKLLQEVSA